MIMTFINGKATQRFVECATRFSPALFLSEPARKNYEKFTKGIKLAVKESIRAMFMKYISRLTTAE